MIQWWGPVIFEYYSCTEGIGMTFTDSAAWAKRPGTVGRALYGTLHIVGEDGGELPVGAEGLVYFSGTLPFSYHKDPDKTREAYMAGGWATVGDLGKVDEDGFLYLTDRKSNMIISGGVNVYPQEAENVLISHPKVFDVAVVGTPHHDLGEEITGGGAARAERAARRQAGGGADRATAASNYSPSRCPRRVDFRAMRCRASRTASCSSDCCRDEYRAKMGA